MKVTDSGARKTIAELLSQRRVTAAQVACGSCPRPDGSELRQRLNSARARHGVRWSQRPESREKNTEVALSDKKSGDGETGKIPRGDSPSQGSRSGERCVRTGTPQHARRTLSHTSGVEFGFVSPMSDLQRSSLSPKRLGAVLDSNSGRAEDL
jgi:hypothetical protein